MRIMFSLPTHICISLSILCHILYQFQSVLNPPTRHPLLQATHFRTCNIIEFEEAKKKKKSFGNCNKKHQCVLSRVSFDVKINRTRLLKAYNVTPCSSLSCPSEVAVVISSQELQEGGWELAAVWGVYKIIGAGRNEFAAIIVCSVASAERGIIFFVACVSQLLGLLEDAEHLGRIVGDLSIYRK